MALKESIKKKTYIDKLRKIQHKFTTTLIGSYRCTSRLKLLKLIGQLDIVDELSLVVESKELDKVERKEFLKSKREEKL